VRADQSVSSSSSDSGKYRSLTDHSTEDDAEPAANGRGKIQTGKQEINAVWRNMHK